MPKPKEEIIKEIELREAWMKKIQKDFESLSSIGREEYRYSNTCAEEMVNALFDEKEELHQKLMEIEFEEWIEQNNCPFKPAQKTEKER